MSTALGTTAQIDSALRRAFSEASVRLQPEARITDIATALSAMGVTVEIEDGVLVLRQGATEMHTVKALRGFAQRPEHAKFFVIAGQHPSSWSSKQKVEFLASHSDDEYRALIQTAVLDAGVKVLDPNMSRADYQNLTRKEKVQFIREFGDGAVGRILGKAK